MSNSQQMNSFQDIKERRQNIIENYKNLIPDIEDFIYSKRNNMFNFDEYVEKIKSHLRIKRNRDLIQSIVDLRNNNDATTVDSNTLFQTDNKYSNEMKKMVKILTSKGYNYNEVVYEFEKIFGSGIITTTEFIEVHPRNERFINFCINLSFLGFMFFGFRKIKFYLNTKIIKIKKK